MEEKKQETKKKHNGMVLFLLLCVIGMAAVSAVVIASKMQTEQKNRDITKEIFDSIEPTEASLTEYIVYGTHLNIKGELIDNLSNVKDVNLVLAGLSGENRNIELNYERTANGISFYTSELINEGIDLETLSIDKHFMLIEVICINRERKQRKRRK